VENPGKTENPACFEKQGMTAEQAQGLSDVIGYAAQDSKTRMHNEQAEVLQRFVSGVNCRPETARDEMMAVKKGFDKAGGVVAYHGYQSFAPGEATPGTAHEIGMKLAQRLWGDRYQVLVATHLDKSDHLHNHFIINTVSHIDGSKFHRTNKDYYDMRRASDALCREHGLSVIENPERGKSKHYAEWDAERGGHPTWRSLVKSDVDAAIRQSMTERQFFESLSKMGYEAKGGKDISVKPPGKERFVRLRRNFGDDYSIEGIRRRILAQARPERPAIPPAPPPKKMRFKGALHEAKRSTGLRALYFYYLYRMGAFPKKRGPSPNRVYFLFREDIRFMQRISLGTRLLVKHGIDTLEQLAAHKDGLAAQIAALSGQRKLLRNRARCIKAEGLLAPVKSEIAAITEAIGALRKEANLCTDIERRSTEMGGKLRRAREDEKLKGRERTRHELYRGCR
jgi:hypothetical protein